MRFSIRSDSHPITAKLGLLAACVALGGCYVAQIPNPNEPALASGEIMNRNFDMVAEQLSKRVEAGQIPPAAREQIMREYMDRYLAQIDPGIIDPREAWVYGDVYRRARNWEGMEMMYELAVAQNPEKTEDFISEDRRVNDHLSLAHAKGELGKVEEAIALARSVMDAEPEMSAPILPGTLLEIVPAARDQGYDAELAELLQQAIQKHEQTIVDPRTDAGKAFLQAKPFHIRNAWTEVVRLYQNTGMQDKAREAIRSYDEAVDRFGTV